MSAEKHLWSFYRQHREEWHGRFVDAVEAAKLQTYTSIPRAELEAALGRSMDLLLESICNHAFDTFVGAMRERIRASVEQGISIEDLHSVLEVEWSVYDVMLHEAVPDDEAAWRELRACGKRMKVAAGVAFTQVLLSR
jgi:hypothetical protein